MPPAPLLQHQYVQIKLSTRLDAFVEERNLGVVFPTPTDVVLSDTDVVQPDILFVSSERSRILTRENVRGAPDLVVEILSPAIAERDRTIKLDLYAQHGVKEYWMVDPDARTITVLLRGETRFGVAGTYGEGQILRSASRRRRYSERRPAALNAETRLTYADHLKTPDDERDELLKGTLAMPPGYRI